jgi:hypothetical protein
LFNPYTQDIHPIAQYAPASVAACVVPAIVYGVGMRLLGLLERTRATTDLEAPGRRRLISPNI